MASTLSMSAAEKLTRLRACMKAAQLAAVIVPSSDAHASEYVAEADKRRAFISGFTGSAGTAVVTDSEARLWTDGRYFLQASMQLDASAGWQLMRDREPATPSIETWLAASLKPGDAVGIDPYCFTIAGGKALRTALEAKSMKLHAEPGANLVDTVWADARPATPCEPVFVHPLKYAGKSVEEKLTAVRAAMHSAGADGLVVCALDEVAWLFNIRGADVHCNPVTLAYAVITAERAWLCIDERKVGADVRAHLAAVATLQPYDSIAELVAATPGKLWMDPTTCNMALYQAACCSEAGTPADVDTRRVLSTASPLQLMKAIKNDAEAEGMRQAHVRDAVALTTFFAWLEAALQRGVDLRTGSALTLALTEVTVSDVLESFRRAQDGFLGLSFDTIAGQGANGAIIHYKPESATAAPVTVDSMFLCDSGGQYVDGTTDVTRTLHFGAPTPHERACFTRVLQGHIALARAKFPVGASGVALDAIARAAVWAGGLDYAHGTGHGVGACLNVHEGPFGAASAPRNTYTGGIQAYMTLSDEPGYYEQGAFGIRIENVLLSVPCTSLPAIPNGKPFLEFESLTVVPVSTNLIEPALLSPAELAWLNAYHASVREKLAPLMQSEWAREYLMRVTQPLAPLGA